MCTKDKKCVLNSCITLMWTIMIFFWYYMKSKTNEQRLLYLTADAEQGVCWIRKILMGQKSTKWRIVFWRKWVWKKSILLMDFLISFNNNHSWEFKTRCFKLYFIQVGQWINYNSYLAQLKLPFFTNTYESNNI